MTQSWASSLGSGNNLPSLFILPCCQESPPIVDKGSVFTTSVSWGRYLSQARNGSFPNNPTEANVLKGFSAGFFKIEAEVSKVDSFPKALLLKMLRFLDLMSVTNHKIQHT